MKKFSFNSKFGLLILSLFTIYNVIVTANYYFTNDWKLLRASLLTIYSGIGILSELLMRIFSLEFSKEINIIFLIISIFLLSPIYFFIGYLFSKILENINFHRKKCLNKH